MLLASALAVAAILGGCDGSEPRLTDSGSLISGSLSSPISARDLGRARAKAHRFAISLLALGRTHRAATLRSATSSLARELAQVAAGGSAELPRRGTALLTLAVSPLDRDRVEATATLAAPSGPEYPIYFELRRVGRRWLAASLPGG